MYKIIFEKVEIPGCRLWDDFRRSYRRLKANFSAVMSRGWTTGSVDRKLDPKTRYKLTLYSHLPALKVMIGA